MSKWKMLLVDGVFIWCVYGTVIKIKSNVSLTCQRMKVSLTVGVNSQNVVSKKKTWKQKKNDENNKRKRENKEDLFIINETEWKCERPSLEHLSCVAVQRFWRNRLTSDKVFVLLNIFLFFLSDFFFGFMLEHSPVYSFNE